MPERRGGKADSRQGNRSRNPVQEVAGLTLRPGPDRNRQQHDVHHREAGNRQPNQQCARLRIPAFFQHGAVERIGLVAQSGQTIQNLVLQPAVGIDHQTLLAQIDAGRAHARKTADILFNLGNAAGAVDRRNRKRHMPRVRGRSGGRFGTGTGYTSRTCGEAHQFLLTISGRIWRKAVPSWAVATSRSCQLPAGKFSGAR